MARISSPEPTGKNTGTRGKSALPSIRYKRIPESFIREYVNGYKHDEFAIGDGGKYRLLRTFQVDKIPVQISIAFHHQIQNYYENEAEIVESVFKEAWSFIPAMGKAMLREWWFDVCKSRNPNHIHLHLASYNPNYHRNDPAARVSRVDVNAVDTGGTFETSPWGNKKHLSASECRKRLRDLFLDWFAYNIKIQFSIRLRRWAEKFDVAKLEDFIVGLEMFRMEDVRNSWLNNASGKHSKQGLEQYIQEMENTASMLRAITTPVPKKSRAKSPRSSQ